MHIGIDLGGTKTEIIAVERDGAVLHRDREATVRDYAGCLAQIAGLVESVETQTGRAGSLGIGIPGSLSPASGQVRNANSVWLNGRRLGVDLAERLDRPVRIENDANCFALSEATDGAGRGFASVFGIILGTGVGGGLVIDGRLESGAQGIAGEWGHNPLPGVASGSGPDCWCGRRACVETFLSGPGLARDHEEAGGGRMTAVAVAAAAAVGEPLAVASMRRYTRRLGRALAVVTNLLDPDVIVLGGGLSNIEGLAEAVTAEIMPLVFSDRPRVTVRRHLHGDSSGVRGAAWLGAGLV